MGTRVGFALIAILATLLLSATIGVAGVVMTETFEGTTGADISTLGWTNLWAGDNILISSVVIDSGKSAIKASTAANVAEYEKAVPSPQPIRHGEEMVLTATARVYVYEDCGDWAEVSIKTNSGNFSMEVDKQWWTYYPDVYAWNISTPYGNFSDPLPAGDVFDMKIVLSRTEARFYGRAHGDPNWTLVRTVSGGATNVTKLGIRMECSNWNPGQQWEIPKIDSLQLSRTETARIKLSENFQGTTGADVSTLGWTNMGSSPILISDVVIDSGKSAIKQNLDTLRAEYEKALSPAQPIAVGQEFVLTATARVYVYEDCGNWAGVSIKTDSGDFSMEVDKEWWVQYPDRYVWNICTPYGNYSDVALPAGDVFDMYILLTRTEARFYGRAHGDL